MLGNDIWRTMVVTIAVLAASMAMALLATRASAQTTRPSQKARVAVEGATTGPPFPAWDSFAEEPRPLGNEMIGEASGASAWRPSGGSNALYGERGD
jgi:hypothetical protein